MFFDWLEKVPEFLKFTWLELSKIMIGAFLVGFMALKWVKSIRKATKAQIEAERHKLAAQLAERDADYQRKLSEEKAQFHQQIADLQVRLAEERVESQKGQIHLHQTCRQAEEERDRLQGVLAKLEKQWKDLEAFDGKLWQRENNRPPPPFLNMADRKVRFVAVMNLKGGVGKTTLTANVGVTLASKGQRVLLVDLDFQGSLTRLCLTHADLNHTVAKGLLCNRLLEDGAGAGQLNPHEMAQRVTTAILENGVCDVIAADDSLAEAELRAQARWLVSQKPDARYLFRQAFHRETFADRYDWVFFDCPPRLTTTCVNALACCDYLLVPVLLEQGSVAALPHTLGWLKQLPHVTHTRLLGVVANRGEFRSEQLIAAQRTIFNYLPEQILRAGFDKRDVFRSVVRNNRNKIESAANEGRIAAATEDGLALFQPVVAEIEKGVMR
jgi:cellulose biosynthesis protein BcsQ